jgi:hypothetical protein
MHNYFDRYKQLSDKYLEINLKRLFSREKQIGTDCLLLKWKDSDYSELMGAGANVLDEQNPISIRIIINKNYMLNPRNHQIDTMVVYTENQLPDLGDVIQFRTREETVRYKIDLVEEYSIDSKKLKRLTLSGYRNSG